MRFTLNLATRLYINTRQVNLVFGILAGVLLVVLALVTGVVVGQVTDQRRLTAELADINAKITASGKGVSDKEYQALLVRIKATNEIIRRKSFNWVGFLDWLERVVPDGVMFTSLEPSIKDGQLKIAGVARNFTTLRTFLENLEDSGFFTDIYLLTQNELKVDDTQKGVSFSISCTADIKKL